MLYEVITHTRIERAFHARRDLCRDLALMSRLVGQHRLADDVADREDVWHIRIV